MSQPSLARTTKFDVVLCHLYAHSVTFPVACDETIDDERLSDLSFLKVHGNYRFKLMVHLDMDADNFVYFYIDINYDNPDKYYFYVCEKSLYPNKEWLEHIIYVYKNEIISMCDKGILTIAKQIMERNRSMVVHPFDGFDYEKKFKIRLLMEYEV